MNFPNEGEYGSERFSYKDGKLDPVDSLFIALDRAKGFMGAFDSYLMENFEAEKDSTMIGMMTLIRDEIRTAYDLAWQDLQAKKPTQPNS